MVRARVFCLTSETSRLVALGIKKLCEKLVVAVIANISIAVVFFLIPSLVIVKWFIRE